MNGALALGFYDPNEKGRFKRGESPLDMTGLGNRINLFRRHATHIISSHETPGLAIVQRIRQLCIMPLTIALGLSSLAECGKRIGNCLLYGLLAADTHLSAKKTGEDAKNPNLQLLKQEAKSAVTAAKIFSFFSNPILVLAYAVLSVSSTSYQSSEESLIDQHVSNRRMIHERNALTQSIESSLSPVEISASKTSQVARRLLASTVNFILAPATTLITLTGRIVLLAAITTVGSPAFLVDKYQTNLAQLVHNQTKELFNDLAFFGYFINPVGVMTLLIESVTHDSLNTHHQIERMQGSRPLASSTEDGTIREEVLTI